MERVLVLGATSAIAAEVAAIHVSRGDRLALVGRSEAKLEALRARFVSAEPIYRLADLSELERNQTVVHETIEALGGLDRVLIAHGWLGDQLASERSFDEAAQILNTNFLSVVALLVPIANHLEKCGKGRIGVITSVAGDRGRPRNYTYGSAKGALNIYLQGLRSRLYAAHVSVTTLKLGPVDTPMTVDHEKTALFGKPAKVARDIVRAMDRRAAEAYVPSFWAAIMPVVRNTPERLFQHLAFLSGR